MAHYPLLFKFRNLVVGNGFIAGIEARGRALMVEESPENWWMYGVQPGALAEGGETWKDAYQAFLNSYTAILVDVAESTSGFEEFKAEVTSFLKDSCEPRADEWHAAVLERRSGNKPEGMKLGEEPADTPLDLGIEKLLEFEPGKNVVEPEAPRLAA